MRKIITLCTVICLCVCLLPCTVSAVSTTDAEEPIILSSDCSLTVNYVRGKLAYSEVKVQIYQIATLSSDFQFTLTEPFRSTGLTLNGLRTSGEWDTIRTTLQSYIVSNELAPLRETLTDVNGAAVFDDLTPGLYLVMPVRFYYNNVFYYFEASLVTVPSLNEDGTWNYDAAVNPKPGTNVPTGKDLEYRVVKLWRDSDKQNQRPVNVLVDIICNDTVVETVTLSAANNWSYSWTALDNGDIWYVAEQNVPRRYVATVEQYATAFTIINTYHNPNIPPKTGDSSNIVLYIMLMCGSGLALVALGVAAGKRKR